MKRDWQPTKAERDKIEAAAKNTTATATQIAGWLGAPVSAITIIVEDVRGGNRGAAASASEPALVANATGAASVSAHSGNGQAQGLLPCPFCGTGPSEDHLAEQVQPYRGGGLSRWWFIRCEKCGVQSPQKKTKEQAIARWNTRAALTKARGDA